MGGVRRGSVVLDLAVLLSYVLGRVGCAACLGQRQSHAEVRAQAQLGRRHLILVHALGEGRDEARPEDLVAGDGVDGHAPAVEDAPSTVSLPCHRAPARTTTDAETVSENDM